MLHLIIKLKKIVDYPSNFYKYTYTILLPIENTHIKKANKCNHKTAYKKIVTGIMYGLVGWLVRFHGISTFVSYLMANPVYMYIKYI